MDPLMGRAEQTSDRTAVVIIMNTKAMMYVDLEFISETFEPRLIELHQMAAGPPESKPRKKSPLFVVLL